MSSAGKRLVRRSSKDTKVNDSPPLLAEIKTEEKSDEECNTDKEEVITRKDCGEQIGVTSESEKPAETIFKENADVILKEENLPQCKVKRNYACNRCDYHTQNPRHYLYHLKDVHSEKIRVYECPHCLYASKHSQKLQRHVHMVHLSKNTKVPKPRARRVIHKPVHCLTGKLSSGKPIGRRVKRVKSQPETTIEDKHVEVKVKDAPPPLVPVHSIIAKKEAPAVKNNNETDTAKDTEDKSPQYVVKKVPVPHTIKSLLLRDSNEFKCSVCYFTSRSKILVQRHEHIAHLKKKFFRCSKCNYVTHMKARYTKHVKYHSMPMIKCDMCDFRTPYKWNLDRHYKNHTGDGTYRCTMCNFTADIKQSLTVHIQNHHASPNKTKKKRNKVGASDTNGGDIDREEMELLRMERENCGEPDNPSFEVSNFELSSSAENSEKGKPVAVNDKKTPKIKMTFKKMKVTKASSFQEQHERHNFQSDFIHPDDIIHKNGNVYIKNLKCNFCNYKAAWETDILRHESKAHGIVHPSPIKPKKFPRPVPNLIPIQNVSEGKNTLPILKIPHVRRRSSLTSQAENKDNAQPSPIISEAAMKEICARSRNSSLKDFASLIGASDAFNLSSELGKDDDKPVGKDSTVNENEPKIAPKEDVTEAKSGKVKTRGGLAFKKKNASFFDRLKEKLVKTDSSNLVCCECGHESKCLSELVRHQKFHRNVSRNINSKTLSSTRCPYCRQRCKTSADLVVHLQTCEKMQRKCEADVLSSSLNDVSDLDKTSTDEQTPKEESSVADETLSDEAREKREPHPMENKVFVWNSCAQMDTEVENDNEILNQSRKADSEIPDDINSELSIEDESQDNSVRSKSPSDSSLVGVETSPGIGAVTGKSEAEQDIEVEAKGPSSMKKVYKCPDCPFWATTASRFHVHIVGHLNKKPFECSLCAYRSNWRWDITKHIKIKSVRDSGHLKARVLMTDETGRRNYSKYGKYLTVMQVHDADGGASKSENNNESEKKSSSPSPVTSQEADCIQLNVSSATSSPSIVSSSQVTCSTPIATFPLPPRLTRAPNPIPSNPSSHVRAPVPLRPPPPLRAAQHVFSRFGSRMASITCSPDTVSMPSIAMYTSPPSIEYTSSLLQERLQQRSVVVPSSRDFLSGGEVMGMSLQDPYQYPPPPPYPGERHESQLSELSTLRPRQSLKRPARMLYDEGKIYEHEVGLRKKAALAEMKNAAILTSSPPDSQDEGFSAPSLAASDGKKTMFKCKKCNFRDASREMVLAHVRQHYQQQQAEASDSKALAPYRCGHCAQRHCRLKHSGDVRVVNTLKDGLKVERRVIGDEQEAERSFQPTGENGVLSGSKYSCDKCPFVGQNSDDLISHQKQHVAQPGAIFKCFFCPFYVPLKRDLLQHMQLHGIKEPEDYISKAMQAKIPQKRSPSKVQDGNTVQEKAAENTVDYLPATAPFTGPNSDCNKRYKCISCPYVSNSKSQFLYHKQFHRPRGAPFKCNYCSYSVTRRHLLHQHLRVHGITVPPQKSPAKGTGEWKIEIKTEKVDDWQEEEEIVDWNEEKNEPEKQEVLNIPKPKFIETSRMSDVPLVWVSRGGKFFKMFKCRHCPHVNIRKINIQEHEKMHRHKKTIMQLHKCPNCNYSCNNAGVLSSHVKVHQSSYMHVHGLVDSSKTDEAQLNELGAEGKYEDSIIEENCPPGNNQENSSFHVNTSENTICNALTEPEEERQLYFCKECPARFFFEKELIIHTRFHGIRLTHKCEVCSYAARQKPHLLAHLKVHKKEYQDRTNNLVQIHDVSPAHPMPPTVIVQCVGFSGLQNAWVVSSPRATRTPDAQEQSVGQNSETKVLDSGNTYVRQYPCEKCPAKFFKSMALQYHLSLHGGMGPYKCSECDYAVKTYGNLVRHEMIHKQGADVKSVIPKRRAKHKHSVPLSGTELFKHREAQKLSNENSEQRNSIPARSPPPLLEDPLLVSMMRGNPAFVYPTYLKNGKLKEKRYKCPKCPSAFEKREQYKVHLSLHGSNQRYCCEKCDYSVKYYANYVQHMRKHKKSEEAQGTSNSENSHAIKSEPVGVSAVSVADDIPSGKTSRADIGAAQELHPTQELSTVERQQLLLQQRRIVTVAVKEEERKMFSCSYCPYNNHRKDALESHMRRHISVNGSRSTYICNYCDYTVPQFHFLREHNKLHFRQQKMFKPEAFMKCEKMELWSYPDEEGKENKVDIVDTTESRRLSFSMDRFDAFSTDKVEKQMVFQDKGNGMKGIERFHPTAEPEVECDQSIVYIDLRNGEKVSDKQEMQRSRVSDKTDPSTSSTSGNSNESKDTKQVQEEDENSGVSTPSNLDPSVVETESSSQVENNKESDDSSKDVSEESKLLTTEKCGSEAIIEPASESKRVDLLNCDDKCVEDKLITSS